MSKFRSEDRDVTSKEIDGISDLVVWAPIKEGFIDAFSNVTYETRLRLVAEALHNVRKSAREHEKVEPFSDTAKRILSLLDFRIGIVDRDLFEAVPDVTDASGQSFRPRKYMYLVATFDGPWEPYMRLIWEPLGAFLDLVLCNCENYPQSLNHDFETYAQWVRDHQLDSAIFYSTSGLTVKDKIYLSEAEAIQRSHASDVGFMKIAQYTTRHPDAVAKDIRNTTGGRLLAWKLGLEALNVLYKLADYYPADSVLDGDGRYLARATKILLNEYEFPGLPADFEDLYRAQLSWYRAADSSANRPENPDPPFKNSEIQKGLLTTYDTDKFVTTHGALLLIRVTDPELAKIFLDVFPFSWEEEPNGKTLTDFFKGNIFTNVAFSFGGLEALGVPDADLKSFPKEFRQGLQERAPLLGDKFENHPRRWQLPERNGPLVQKSNDRPIELSEIDLAIQVRSGYKTSQSAKNIFQLFSMFARGMVEEMKNAEAAQTLEEQEPTLEQILLSRFIQEHNIDDDRLGDSIIGEPLPPGEPLSFDWLHDELIAMSAQRSNRPLIELFIFYFALLGRRMGLEVVGVEDMFRPKSDTFDQRAGALGPNLSEAIDHFGFRDGISQPIINEKFNENSPVDHVPRGEMFYGYKNVRGDTNVPKCEPDLKEGCSFLVVRKMRQDVEAFEKFERDHSTQLVEGMVGRKKGMDGTPLIRPTDGLNGFDYKADPKGQQCPFSAHMRLSNPRDREHGRRHPMILRRGMSFGERYDPGNEDHQEETVPQRGTVFMAYCASIAEQYEVIQRWLNAGNSTNVTSAQNDPLTGAHPANGRQYFRSQITGQIEQVRIEKPFVTLDWGHYFFVPSRTALQRIVDFPMKYSADPKRAKSGEAIIQQIEQLPIIVQRDEWKRILEDYLSKDPAEHDITPRVWEAIDARGGAIRIESGIAFDRGKDTPPLPKDPAQKIVLVTRRDLILQVFDNECLKDANGNPTSTTRPFSSIEQKERISATNAFGTIYVSLDAPCPHAGGKPPALSRYHQEAYPTNSILLAQTEDAAIEAGFKAGVAALEKFKKVAEKYSQPPLNRPLEFKIELGQQYFQNALAVLCEEWFGIPDGEKILPGGWDWGEERDPVCPGDFLSPSRHAFYPRPTSTIETYGLRHGASLRKAVESYIDERWTKPGSIKGVVASKMHKELRKLEQDGTHNPSGLDLKELMGRNLIGIMIGALPPMDANLRFAMLEWLNEETLWRLQSDFRQLKQTMGPYKAAKEALYKDLKKAMCLRPAPDLIYRTATQDTKLNNVEVKKGEMVILCLSAATQALVRENNPSVELIFGGYRKNPVNGDLILPEKHPQHACPALDMAMGGMIGILAALLDAGTIQALPASLIVRVSDWDK